MTLTRPPHPSKSTIIPIPYHHYPYSNNHHPTSSRSSSNDLHPSQGPQGPHGQNVVLFGRGDQSPSHNQHPTTYELQEIPKPKRKRITPEQLQVLTELFKQTDTPSFEIRESLAERLRMTNREVQVWFQNRRAKMNKLRLAQIQQQQQQQRDQSQEERDHSCQPPSSPSQILKSSMSPTLSPSHHSIVVTSSNPSSMPMMMTTTTKTTMKDQADSDHVMKAKSASCTSESSSTSLSTFESYTSPWTHQTTPKFRKVSSTSPKPLMNFSSFKGEGFERERERDFKDSSSLSSSSSSSLKRFSTLKFEKKFDVRSVQPQFSSYPSFNNNSDHHRDSTTIHYHDVDQDGRIKLEPLNHHHQHPNFKIERSQVEECDQDRIEDWSSRRISGKDIPSLELSRTMGMGLRGKIDCGDEEGISDKKIGVRLPSLRELFPEDDERIWGNDFKYYFRSIPKSPPPSSNFSMNSFTSPSHPHHQLHPHNLHPLNYNHDRHHHNQESRLEEFRSSPLPPPSHYWNDHHHRQTDRSMLAMTNENRDETRDLVLRKRKRSYDYHDHDYQDYDSPRPHPSIRSSLQTYHLMGSSRPTTTSSNHGNGNGGSRTSLTNGSSTQNEMEAALALATAKNRFNSPTWN